MPFSDAISSGEKTLLHGDYYATQWMAVCPNTEVFAASVNQSSFDASFAEVTFDTVTTGAYTDIKEGFTVYIGTGSDVDDYEFVGRIRKAATSTVI